jgi:hypothetical protein
MTTEELREAAMKILSPEASACFWDSDDPEDGPALAQHLARAWLAEHPPEPITRTSPPPSRQ